MHRRRGDWMRVEVNARPRVGNGDVGELLLQRLEHVLRDRQPRVGSIRELRPESEHGRATPVETRSVARSAGTRKSHFKAQFGFVDDTELQCAPVPSHKSISLPHGRAVRSTRLGLTAESARGVPRQAYNLRRTW